MALGRFSVEGFVFCGGVTWRREYIITHRPHQDCREREEDQWWKVWKEGRDLAAAQLQAAVRGQCVRRRLWVEVSPQDRTTILGSLCG